MSNNLKILLSIILVLCLSACDNFSCKGKQKRKSKVFLVLFDLSLSVDNNEMIKSYTDNFKTIVSKSIEGDVIVAGQITEKSVTEITLPVNIKLPSFESNTDNNLYRKAQEDEFKKKFAKIKDSICNTVDTLLNCKRSIIYTDIFSSLQLAENVFKTYSDYDKVLVIMSDMVEDSPDFNFNKESLTTKRINEIIELKKKNSNIPDLSGVKVYITGACSKNSNKYSLIQNFWMEYFKVCKANLAKCNYNSMLIKFDE